MSWLKVSCIIGLVISLGACSEAEDKLIDISIGDVESISISRYDEQLVMEKTDGDWEVVVPFRSRANPEAIGKFLATIDTLSSDAVVSDDPVDYGQYGVDENAFVVIVRTPTASNEILVGRQGTDFNTQHVRINDDPTVHLARGRINTIMRLDVWRYRTIMELDPSDIVAAEFFVHDKQSRLFSENDTWILTDSTGTHEVLDERIAEWASFFNPLTTDRFAEVARELVTEHAQRKIVFELGDGTERTLEFLDLQGEWGVGVDDSDTVFQIFSLRLDNMFPDLLPFYY